MSFLLDWRTLNIFHHGISPLRGHLMPVLNIQGSKIVRLWNLENTEFTKKDLGARRL